MKGFWIKINYKEGDCLMNMAHVTYIEKTNDRPLITVYYDDNSRTSFNFDSQEEASEFFKAFWARLQVK